MLRSCWATFCCSSWSIGPTFKKNGNGTRKKNRCAKCQGVISWCEEKLMVCYPTKKAFQGMLQEQWTILYTVFMWIQKKLSVAVGSKDDWQWQWQLMAIIYKPNKQFRSLKPSRIPTLLQDYEMKIVHVSKHKLHWSWSFQPSSNIKQPHICQVSSIFKTQRSMQNL